MPWDYKRDFEFLANVVKMQNTFHFLVGGTLYSEHSVNPLNLFFCLWVLHSKLGENRQ